MIRKYPATRAGAGDGTRAIARAGARDASLITRAAMFILLLTALAFWGAAGARAAEDGPAALEHTAGALASGIAIKIGADLTANDGSGETAPWAFSYDASGAPDQLTVEVTVHQTACGTETPVVTYSTSLDAAGVADLIQWLSAVRQKMLTAGAR